MPLLTTGFPVRCWTPAECQIWITPPMSSCTAVSVESTVQKLENGGVIGMNRGREQGTNTPPPPKVEVFLLVIRAVVHRPLHILEFLLVSHCGHVADTNSLRLSTISLNLLRIGFTSFCFRFPETRKKNENRVHCQPARVRFVRLPLRFYCLLHFLFLLSAFFRIGGGLGYT